jgi:sec-independent protein translocase protein TatB
MPSSRKCWRSGPEGATSPVPKSLRPPAALIRQRGFLDFSFSELAIIFGLALVVLGPKKLPGLVQQVGRWVGRARHMARQFREQLEQEVNAINEVKPVPRHVAPDVGPPAPGSAPAEPHPEMSSTAAGDVAQSEPAAATPPQGAHPAAADAAPNDVHPEAQIYFAMNGSEPEVVAHDPYAPFPGEAAQAADTALPAPAGAAPPAAAKPAEPAQPASVEVLFPHDHG